MKYNLKRRIVKLFCVLFIVILGLGPVAIVAQSVDDVLYNSGQKSEKIREVQQALQDGDQITQYALVEALLKEEDKALRRIGREHALFSINPVLQSMAIESAFATNAQVRIVISNPTKPEALGWLEAAGGAQDGQTGFVMMPVGSFDAASSCWLDPVFRRCRFTIIGNTVQFGFYANGGQAINRAQAALTLQPDGQVRGAFISGFGQAVMSIDLKE